MRWGESNIYKRKGKDRWETVPGNPIPKEVKGISVGRGIYLWSKTALFHQGKGFMEKNNWKEIELPPVTDLFILTFTIKKQAGKWILYLGTTQGLYWSDNNGKDWKKAKGYIANAPIRSISLLSNGILLLGTDDRGVMLGTNPSLWKMIFGGVSEKM